MVDAGGHIGPMTFAAVAGARTITLDPGHIDLSRRHQLQCVLTVTAADTDAGDTLDGVVQFSWDGTIWNTVGAWETILGTDSPSSTAPEIRVLVIQQMIPIEGVEEAYEPTGSAGAAPLVVNSVRNTSFPMKAYIDGVWVPTLRFVLSQVDVDLDGGFAGQVDVFYA